MGYFHPELLADWQNYLAQDASRPAGLDLYPDLFACPLAFPLQRQEEMRAMMQRARKVQPKTIMEIGADKGGGIYHWCKCFPKVKQVIACEIEGTPYSQMFEKAFPRIKFLWLPSSSYNSNTIDKLKNFLGGKHIDVLFIDGDKSAFEIDFDCYKPMLNPQGVVFMHDIQDEAPGTAFNRVISRGYPYETIINVEDYKRLQERIDAGGKPETEHENWLEHWQGRSCGVGVIRPVTSWH